MTPVMFFELARITINEIIPRTTVKAILPVTFAVPGINPIILLIRIKKKTVKQVRKIFFPFMRQDLVLLLHHEQK